MRRPACICWANLTPFSRQAMALVRQTRDVALQRGPGALQTPLEGGASTAVSITKGQPAGSMNRGGGGGAWN
jgi:hypothetical protein